MSIEKSLRILLARRAGKLKQGRILRLQVQNGHGSLQKFQEEVEIIHKAYGRNDEIEEKSPEFPEEGKLYDEICKAVFPDHDLAKNDGEEAFMKETLSWQLKEEVALKLEEVYGDVEAGTAVQEDTVEDPEEVRTKKKQAGATGTTTEPDAAIEGATADVPEEVRAEKKQRQQMIMKETQANEAHHGQPEAEGYVIVKAEDEQLKEEKVGVLTKRAHPLKLTQNLEVGQLRTTKKKLDAMVIDVIVEPKIIPESHAEAVVVEKPQNDAD